MCYIVLNRHMMCMEQGHDVYGTETLCVWNRDMMCMEQGHDVYGTGTLCVWNRDIMMCIIMSLTMYHHAPAITS